MTRHAQRHRGARSSAVLADVRLRVADWRAMLDRVADEIAELKTNPPPLPVGEIAEAIQFLEWLIDDNFTFLGVRDYELCTGEDALDPMFESGLGILRARDVHVRAALEPAAGDHAGDPRAPEGADAADRHQGGRALARAPPRLHGLCRRQALRRGRHAHRRIPHRRPVHLDRLYALDPHHPVSAPQGRRGARRAPASIPTAIPARRWSTCWRPIRATSCSRSTRTRCYQFAHGDPAARRAAARAGAAAARPLRPLRVGAGLCAARRATTATVRERDRRTIWPASIKGRVSAFSRSFPKGRWSACISSSGASPGAHGRSRIAPSSKRRSRRSCAPGSTSSATSSARSLRSARGPRALFERYRGAFSAGYRDNYSPAAAVADIRIIEGLSAEPAARRRLPSPRRAATATPSA